MISTETKSTILATAKVDEVIAEFISLKKHGKDLIGKCPKCDAEGKGKGVVVSPSKHLYKCFSCDWGGNSSVDFLIDINGMKYPEALKYLAQKYNILVDEKVVKGPQRKKEKIATYRDNQLSLSGLTDEDQKATVYKALGDEDSNKHTVVDTFVSGTLNQYGRLDEGDDVIIWYYDLEGKPVMFQRPKGTTLEHLYRIRWQNPDAHLDRNGNPIKYQSPAGSGSHLFIPETIREAYRNARVIKRLYIQEGEKKTLKACKHGIPSVGIMGIHNIGSNGKLPYELQLIVNRCKVEEVVFVLDSDWDHLSNSIKSGSKVDSRPWTFYSAVKNYREYMITFKNLGIYLEILFGYIKENPKQDKGIDDLLNNTLKLRENDLYADFDRAINERNGTGEFVQVYKITSMPDMKLMELWNLHNSQDFAEKYADKLEDLKEFQIGKAKWKFDEKGKLVSSQPLLEDELFWDIRTATNNKTGLEYTSIQFKYEYCYTFLKRRGFGRIMMANKKFELCQIEKKAISVVDHFHIRDFVKDFTKGHVPKNQFIDVIDMLHKGGKMYFGPDSLSNVDYIHPVFESAGKNYQMFYFKDSFWKITAEGIEEKSYTELENYLWKDQVINFQAKVLGDDFIEVNRIDNELFSKSRELGRKFSNYVGQYMIDFSKTAEESHFIKFMWNTGEFAWRKTINPEHRKANVDDTRTTEEMFETNLHFISKMTAFGYMLHDFRDKNCEKAVIAMDGKLSEVGDSNGRTGKSIFGFAIDKCVPTVYVSGKTKDITEDPFIFEEVTEKTKTIFIDDARANIDFEFFFPVITGRLTVNQKGVGKFTLPENKTPKLYITTNHAINGSSSSFRDRQSLIAFSDFYSDDHKPVEDFGMVFFDEWDDKQWNLFYNYMARCVQLYFIAQRKGWGDNKTGIIPAPVERLEQRRLRQEVGEVFMTWGDERYGLSDGETSDKASGPNINSKEIRKDMFNDFLDRNPTQRKYVTTYIFYRKLMAYCKLRGLKINPHIPKKVDGKPGYDKSGGVEYLTIANEFFDSNESNN